MCRQCRTARPRHRRTRAARMRRVAAAAALAAARRRRRTASSTCRAWPRSNSGGCCATFGRCRVKIGGGATRRSGGWVSLRVAVSVRRCRSTRSSARRSPRRGRATLVTRRLRCSAPYAWTSPRGSMSVGDLWENGAPPPGRSGQAQLQWSYVPVVAWLKPYPAHSPQVLPPGLVTEEMFVAGSSIDRHLMYLRHAALRTPLPPPPPPPRAAPMHAAHEVASPASDRRAAAARTAAARWLVRQLGGAVGGGEAAVPLPVRSVRPVARDALGGRGAAAAPRRRAGGRGWEGPRVASGSEAAHALRRRTAHLGAGHGARALRALARADGCLRRGARALRRRPMAHGAAHHPARQGVPERVPGAGVLLLRLLPLPKRLLGPRLRPVGGTLQRSCGWGACARRASTCTRCRQRCAARARRGRCRRTSAIGCSSRTTSSPTPSAPMCFGCTAAPTATRCCRCCGGSSALALLGARRFALASRGT